MDEFTSSGMALTKEKAGSSPMVRAGRDLERTGSAATNIEGRIMVVGEIFGDLGTHILVSRMPECRSPREADSPTPIICHLFMLYWLCMYMT